MKYAQNAVLCAALICSSAVVKAKDEVTIKLASDVTHCTFVTTETVGAGNEESALAKHRKRASEAEADTLVIVDSSTTRYRKPSLAGGIQSVTKVSVEAGYYQCSDKNQTEQTSSSVKDRLQQLKELREEGLIDNDEYKMKKADILEDL